MNKITLATLLLFFSISLDLFSQNDFCSASIALNPDETAIGNTNSGGTVSGGGSSACPHPLFNDYWYSFIAPPSGEVTVSSDSDFAIYNSCVGATLVYCGTGNNNVVQSLQDGATYYIQVVPFPVTCKGLACGDFSIMVSGNVLSNEEFATNQFKVYPNPVSDVLKINTQKELKNIQVYNILGKQLISIVPNNLETILDFSDFSSGHYILKLNSKHASKIIKVFKK
ncbi:T9SS type A sorting domain-containing protein [Algibacter sp. 2305UL17-15]|uniref:T9SS type A sorting domain-containing protein n=1 Tax=Algibacter sp. 2305UL17-15 TaxID=3231268 RepID=UPI00345B0656